ncbi:hypothetical protein KHA76_003628 [Salmonella enterica subsp. houtenae serovar 44:z36,[z38]:-]|uniref:Fimbrial protein n=1 Tax=Salmonella enterica subsp. houtenae serovar 44:z36[z38]:- TaxID=1967609 RepID=A0A736I806_SALHO|nr:hypothetical protein [Salmonella enterica]ECZ5471582.1 hypothetical protein [Salmonella enterica subsp. houtenae]EDP9795109.1 hypothetical protein [Salmonella enterica subsp. salamae]EHM8759204.1 hypothetical protein [Salmonella enterica subsp. houtenae serovar 44:z36,[z38]:-]HAE7581363.1 hypothetical protein [Salmonella enterica subsp. houtenae serovar 44:z36[z38]:-]HCM1978831.1 hypothetical protein [Salmonella enterica subsp. houtenae serovar 47:z36:-]HCM6269222.1 hypothetical protein [S
MLNLSKKTSLNILVLFTLWGLLLPKESPAARCTGVTVHFNIPDEISITGKKVGDIILDFEKITTISGSCKKENTSITEGQYLYLVDRIKQPTPPGNWCGDDSVFSEISPDGIVRLLDQPSCGQSLIYYGLFRNLAQGAGGVLSPFNHNKLLLNKKIPGRTKINPLFFIRNDFVSLIGGYPDSLQSEFVAISGVKDIDLVYTPSCSARLENVVFPEQTSSAIQSGTVTPQQASINVSCDDILPKYTVKISSPRGIPDDKTPTDGIIKSDNPSVGYRLTWGDNQVGTGNVALNSALTPARLPSTSNFSLPIDIRPVSLVPKVEDIISGPSGSSIQVDLTFN